MVILLPRGWAVSNSPRRKAWGGEATAFTPLLAASTGATTTRPPPHDQPSIHNRPRPPTRWRTCRRRARDPSIRHRRRGLVAPTQPPHPHRPRRRARHRGHLPPKPHHQRRTAPVTTHPDADHGAACHRSRLPTGHSSRGTDSCRPDPALPDTPVGRYRRYPGVRKSDRALKAATLCPLHLSLGACPS